MQMCHLLWTLFLFLCLPLSSSRDKRMAFYVFVIFFSFNLPLSIAFDDNVNLTQLFVDGLEAASFALSARFVFRWSIPSGFLLDNRAWMSSSKLSPSSSIQIIAGLAFLFMASLSAQDEKSIKSIVLLVFTTISLLYGSRFYIWNRLSSVVMAIAIPFAFLVTPLTVSGLWVDSFLLLSKISFITLLVAAVDKTVAVIETYPEQFKTSNNRITLVNTVKAFLIQPKDLPMDVLQDIQMCQTVLDKSGSNTKNISFIVDPIVRQDALIIYAFARITDDLVDEVTDKEVLLTRLTTIKAFIEQLFSHRRPAVSEWKYTVHPVDKDPTRAPELDWCYFEKRLTPEHLSVFRALSRIAYYLPAEAFYELLTAYEWDIQERLIKDETELLEYTTYGSSSILVLLAAVEYEKSSFGCGKWTSGLSNSVEAIRDIGKVIYLAHFARDLAEDSIKLHRCYLPLTMLDNKMDYRYLINGRPQLVPLKKYSDQLIARASQIMDKAVPGLRGLPTDLQGLYIGYASVYLAASLNMYNSKEYAEKLQLSRWIALCVLYISMAFKVPTVSKYLSHKVKTRSKIYNNNGDKELISLMAKN